MDLMEIIDGYCERTDATYWSEPMNAVTNAAFIVAAVIMWRRTPGVPMARALCVILLAIGVGSFLFHTHATAWASVADTSPIGLFILTYLYAVNRDMVGLRGRAPGFATALFLPYAAIMVPVLNSIPFFAVSNFYWTVPVLLFAYAAWLWRRYPSTARGLALGGALLSLSITIRSLDQTLCADWPLGTHFLWHLLNALMLALMIEVYRRHVLATARTQG